MIAVSERVHYVYGCDGHAFVIDAPPSPLFVGRRVPTINVTVTDRCHQSTSSSDSYRQGENRETICSAQYQSARAKVVTSLGCASRICRPLCFAARIGGPSMQACEPGRVNDGQARASVDKCKQKRRKTGFSLSK
jgi:hypothetical protein